ncbi:MAG: RNA-binding S4 domain-containing protein [Acidaminococcaceae bacterium]|nr:RNA-binding S4 domain-containing protein [Acidaminococcaceae bacterium]MBQ9635815.1 RNA-binding S4 domain-containing protein [Acidaminococcaceae bacterium]MBR1590449.1 RNA-binding S4 domain-containing protein [Acidaminococcaceae bacterium]
MEPVKRNRKSLKEITIEIDTDFIPAVALLKLAGVVESGGQASLAVEQGHITMDGVVLQEKRKKIRPGSTVVFNNQVAIHVTGAAKA